jgi:hypothetical protein
MLLAVERKEIMYKSRIFKTKAGFLHQRRTEAAVIY